MSRTVPPDRWDKYARLRRDGLSRHRASGLAGISEPTARMFDRERRQEANGTRSPRRSSGWLWLALCAEERRLTEQLEAEAQAS